MSSSKLWGTSIKGNVYILPLDSKRWKQIPNQTHSLQGFKKVLGCTYGAWGLGCDHQLYVYVEQTDVPIRIQESTYENERWLPTQGWRIKNLLPLDPYGWSNIDGSVHVPRDNIKLPATGWAWEGEWKVDTSINGHLTDGEGWRYSDLGFHHTFSHKKSFRSCVRRRKWIRYRRYTGHNSWTKLASLHIDPLEDPIVDFSLGGQNLPNQQQGCVGIWIATIDGKLIYRVGACVSCPGGVSWVEVRTTDDQEVVAVSTGPTGMVWALTWQGNILARNGVTWQNTRGVDWSIIPHPEGLGATDKIVQVSVGQYAAWAVSAEGKVWLRHGITETDIHGNAWLQMVNNMKFVTIAPNDKVFGIDQEDRQLYYRGGVSPEELSGKCWRSVDLPFTSVNTRRRSLSISSVDENSISSKESELNTRGVCSTSSHQEDVFRSIQYNHTQNTQTKSIVPNQNNDQFQDMNLPVYNDNKFGRDTVCTLDGYGDSHVIPEADSDELDQTLYLSLVEEKDTLDVDLKDADSNDDSFVSAHSDSLDFENKNIFPKTQDGELTVDEIDLECNSNEDLSGAKFGHLTFDLDDSLGQGGGSSSQLEESVKGVNAISINNHQSVRIESRNMSQPTSTVQDKVDVVWDANPDTGVDNTDSGSSEHTGQRIKGFISFKRLRSLGSRIKNPVDVIQKIKTAKPKQVLADLRSDFRDQKEEVLRTFNRAESVFRHGKSSSENDETFSVEFKKADVDQEMKLAFVNKESMKHDPCQDHTVSSSSINNNTILTAKQEKQITHPVIQGKSMNSMNSIKMDKGNRFTSVSSCDIGEDNISLNSESYSLVDIEEERVWLPTEADIGEIQWAWISAEVCSVREDGQLNHWLNKDTALSDLYHRQIAQSSWRNRILSSLRDRNKQQCAKFNSYELSIEKAGWSKTVQMKWWQDVYRGQKWIICQTELTHGSEAGASSLILKYTWRGSEEHIYIDLKDILCVRCEEEEVSGTATVFCVYTGDRQNTLPATPPYRFSTATEAELEDWVCSLCSVITEISGYNNSLSTRIWSITNRGDVFIHKSQDEVLPELANQMPWSQLGGHLKILETCTAGVTWGVSHKGDPYVYTGGYGGGFFKGGLCSPYGIHAMTDIRERYVYENQRWRLGRGYTEKARLVTHYMWSDESGHKEVTKDSVRLASCHWAWLGDWTVDYSTPGGVDKEGWQYATGKSFRRQFFPAPRLTSYLRRRRWVRRSQVTTSGPWEVVGLLPLADISLQSGAATAESQSISMWAVGQNGDMLYRADVTVGNPKGSGWIHVTSDEYFVNVSVSVCNIVWGITKEGGIWCRQGITTIKPTGSHWSHVEPPNNCPGIVQVSAGKYMVCALDKTGVIWHRSGVTDDKPEGEKWVKGQGSIKQVSVGPQDQLWFIREKVEGKMGPIQGVVSRRVGIPSSDLSQGAWDNGIGGGWNYVSVRGWIK